jgi:hypothetical protein
MGFWSKLFGRKEATTVELPKVVVADVTPTPAETVPTIAEVEAQVEELLRELFIAEPTPVKSDEEIAAEKKRKRSEAAKRAAATRAKNKVKKGE